MTSFKHISLVALSLFSLLHPCFCGSNRKLASYSYTDLSNPSSWTPGGATWYGNAYGYGSDGGACGYQDAVGKTPFNSMIAAGSPSLYKSGQGCGACYQVRCTSNSACSGNPVTIVITDECPGCLEEPAHFDLSGTAFGALARSFQAGQLRNAGKIMIEYRRVSCNYGGTKITFHMDMGSNNWYLAVLIEYVKGDGDLTTVDLMQGGYSYSKNWTPMIRSWGAVWRFNSGPQLQPPFSFRLTSGSGKTLIVPNVVPIGWTPGNVYTSKVNF